LDKRQENFERSVILESDLPMYYSKDGDPYTYTLDTYPNDYLTLGEVASEYGREFDFDERQMLKIVITERFNRLNDLQRQIADLKYIQNKTVREIANDVNRAISTVQYHIDKVNKIIRSI
jgi:DNA-directed RNA polymerase specialized sigma subunit